jgi:hypothetical protein
MIQIRKPFFALFFWSQYYANIFTTFGGGKIYRQKMIVNAQNEPEMFAV